MVTGICFGLPIFMSVRAVLAGFPEAKFSDSSNIWLAIVEVVLGGVALLFLRSCKFDIKSLYPEPTFRGALLGVGLFLVCWLVGSAVTSLFDTPGRPGVVEFSFAGASLATTVLAALVNGAFEEVFLLGALVRGLRGLGLSLAIGLPLLVRVLYHLYQGPVGVLWVASFGVTLTLAYVVTRELWPPVLAHILWDIVRSL